MNQDHILFRGCINRTKDKSYYRMYLQIKPKTVGLLDGEYVTASVEPDGASIVVLACDKNTLGSAKVKTKESTVIGSYGLCRQVLEICPPEIKDCVAQKQQFKMIIPCVKTNEWLRCNVANAIIEPVRQYERNRDERS